MKLSPLDRLLARLALQVTASELEDLKFQCHELNQVQKDQATSAIRLFDVLRQTYGDTANFLTSLERLFSDVEHFGKYRAIIRAFKSDEPYLQSTMGGKSRSQNVSDDQRHQFRKTLSGISGKLQKNKLEIMVMLSPLPRGCKDGLREGFKLFDELRLSGFISETDVELLEDFFDVLAMKDATDLLYQYQQKLAPPSPYSTQCSTPVVTWSPLHPRTPWVTPPSWPHTFSGPLSFSLQPGASSGSPMTVTSISLHSTPLSMPVRLSVPPPAPDLPLTPLLTTFSGPSKRSSGESSEAPPPKRLMLSPGAKQCSLPLAPPTDIPPKSFAPPTEAPPSSDATPISDPPGSGDHTPSAVPGPAAPSKQLSTGSHRWLTPSEEQTAQPSQQESVEPLWHRAEQVGVASSSPASTLGPRHGHTPIVPFCTSAGVIEVVCQQEKPHPTDQAFVADESYQQGPSLQPASASGVVNGPRPLCMEHKCRPPEELNITTETAASTCNVIGGSNVITSREHELLQLASSSHVGKKRYLGRCSSSPGNVSTEAPVHAGGGSNVIASRELLRLSDTSPAGGEIRSGEIQCNITTETAASTCSVIGGNNVITSREHSSHVGKKRYLGHCSSPPGNVSTEAPVHAGGGSNVIASREILCLSDTSPAGGGIRSGEIHHQETMEGEEGGVETGEERIPQAEQSGDEEVSQAEGTGDEDDLEASEGGQVITGQSSSMGITTRLKSLMASMGNVLSSSS